MKMSLAMKLSEPTFVVFEGIDGSGKTTQAKKLVDVLNRHGNPAAYVAFPRRKELPLGPIIDASLRGRAGWKREDLQTLDPLEALYIRQSLMTVDKISSEGFIIDKLTRDKITVVCDRWADSAIAYGVADGLDREWLFDINDSLLEPDVSILIDLPANERYRVDVNEVYEQSLEKQEALRGTYRDLFLDDPKKHIINGLGGIDDVHEAILSLLKSLP